MDVDPEAQHYAWFDSEDPSNRRLVVEWWPNGRIISDASLGTVYAKRRANPWDTWPPPTQIGQTVMFLTARSFARGGNLLVEVANYADGAVRQETLGALDARGEVEA